MSSLIDKRLVVVTGKGGTGKTTVAASRPRAAARAVKRTVVCEVAEQERLAALFGVEPLGHNERELAPGLSGASSRSLWPRGSTPNSAARRSCSATSQTTVRFTARAAALGLLAATVVLPVPPLPVTTTSRLSMRDDIWVSLKDSYR